MASMELTPEESKAEGAEMTDYKPKWAVSEMYLDENAMKALGLTVVPALGSMVEFRGVAKIVSGRLDDDEEGDTGKLRMSIQPVDLDVSKPAADAKAMYPNSKMES